MTDIPAFAPGCFGSALAFQEDHTVCQNCKFAAACRPVHEANLAILRDRCNIKIKPKPQRSPENVANPGAKVLSQKVQDYLDKIEGSGVRITESFSRGENPFGTEKMKFMYIAAHVLLNIGKPLRANVLAAAYTSKLKCGAETAGSYARIAFQIFKHVGAVDEVDGGYTLRRD